MVRFKLCSLPSRPFVLCFCTGLRASKLDALDPTWIERAALADPKTTYAKVKDGG